MEGIKRDKETEKPPRPLVPEQTKNARQEHAGRCKQEMSKEKPIQNTEKKGTDILHCIIWKPVKEKRKTKTKEEKEKDKGKTASVRSDPLGREWASRIRSALAIWD